LSMCTYNTYMSSVSKTNNKTVFICAKQLRLIKRCTLVLSSPQDDVRMENFQGEVALLCN
jgi:hypothetical protein